ncbi:MAG: hydantoinase/oxoprolinase family protein [Candidatus Eremiobacteraeota bacterium]|nr:hydantoinase/oxoprolinase family protein [Candidatus Eremiobacteraeota bacterium]
MSAARLRVGIDVGGTFTDLEALDGRGEVIRLKVPSTPDAPERAVVAALDALRARFKEPPEIDFLGHSTTIATNALLGQEGLQLPRVALVTTHGFRDVIEIGRQNRSEVYNLFTQRPHPLVARTDRITVVERIDYRGQVLVPLDEESLDGVVDALRERGVGAVAICFLHSYVNDVHEQRAAEAIARALPDVSITRSSSIAPEYREYERFSTAVVNAVLAPIVTRYLESLQKQSRVSRLYILRSDGGLSAVSSVATRPAALLESGPAAGVIAAAALARNESRVLAFDMGGTTAKAGAIVDGCVQIATEFEAAGKTHSGRALKGSGYPIRFPFVDLAEVSAGGGTLAWIDDADSLRVGPLSAGADPGPACYGRSERPTVTDANVVLGRLNQTHLLGGTFPIDASRSRDAVAPLAAALQMDLEEAAAGIVTLIDAAMAKVLRIVTIERGLDPREFTLVAYGGGGPLHVCALAEELAIVRVLIPAHPGIFSAQGLLVADLTAVGIESLLCEVGDLDFEPAAIFERLEACGREELLAQGVAADSLRFARSYDARYRGQSFELPIPHADSPPELAQRFHDAHRACYGYHVAGERIELVNARSTASGRLESSVAPITALRVATKGGCNVPHRSVWIDGSFVDVPVYQRDTLPSRAIEGPAIIEQYDSTTYIAPGWTCETNAASSLALRRRTGGQA